MSYPAEFYFSEAQSDIDYQTMPTGNLSVPRLIKNKTYWIRPVAPHAQKQKNLVLADWSILNCSKDRFHAMRNALTQLMEDGFSIYYWQDGQVTPLSKERIDDLLQDEVQKKMRPAYTEEMTVAAIKQHGLTHDNVQILDTYLLDHVLQGKTPEEGRTIRLSDYLALDQDARQLLIDIMVKTIPPVNTLIQDVFAENSHFPQMLLQQFPEATILDRFEKVKLNRTDINNLLALGSIRRGDRTLSVENLSQLKNLIIDGDVHHDDLQLLLSKTSNLRTLDVSTNHLFSLIQDSLPFLETVSFSNADIDKEELQNLLHAAPNLRTLNSYRGTFFGQSSLSAEQRLKLVEINLPYQKISNKDLESLLMESPQLQKLDLSGCSNIHILSIDDKPLSNLTELNLSSSNTTTYSLEKWLRAAPKLKKLNISDCYMMDEDLNFIPEGLKHLEELTLNGAHFINSTSIETLLENASQLKRLYLRNCNLIGLFKTRHFSELEELDLNGGQIDAAGLSALLAAAPKLKKLSLQGVTDLIDVITLDSAILSKLEEITLPRGMDPRSLDVLLKAAPNLKTLSLEVTKDMGNLNMASLSMPHLKKMKISFTKYNTEQMHALLNAAPHIEELELDYSGPLNLQPEFFKDLKQVKFSSFTSSNLQELIKAAPNLQKIVFEIGNVSNITFNFTEDSLPYVEEIIFNPAKPSWNFDDDYNSQSLESIFADKALEKLLLATPNLKSIHLGKHEGLDKNFYIPPNSLAKLEEITLEDPISAEGLQNLLLAALT